MSHCLNSNMSLEIIGRGERGGGVIMNIVERILTNVKCTGSSPPDSSYAAIFGVPTEMLVSVVTSANFNLSTN